MVSFCSNSGIVYLASLYHRHYWAVLILH